jgi:CelD/BcsL family acetyltransferase involved in cellulose biosynthesis
MDCIPFSAFLASRLEAWTNLQRELGTRPDLGPAWVQALARAHSLDASDMQVLFDESNGRLEWMLPIVVQRQRILGGEVRCVLPITSVYCLHFDVLSRQPIDATLATAFDALNRDGDWHEIVVHKVVEGSPAEAALHAVISSHGLSVTSKPGQKPPFLEITTDWQRYLDSKSGSFRYNLKRKEKKIEKAGRYALQFFERGSDWTTLFDQIETIETSSWKHEAGTSLRPFEKVFYGELVATETGDYYPLLTLLTLDGAPLAYDLSIVGAGRGFCLKTSYVSEQSHLSPGIVLRAALMKRMFDEGLAEYDFLGNNEPYKLEWASGVRQETSLRIGSRRTSARVLRGLRALKHAALKGS